ncbi:MAG: extracellular solute-binding protein [Litorilinea sp.]
MTDSRLSRRNFLLGTSAVISGALLAACGPTAPQGSTAPAATGGEAPAPSGEDVELIFHSRLGSHADWHKQRVPLFEEQHPGVKLAIDEIPGEEMYPKVYAMAASGTVGDVVWTYLNNPPEHKTRGVMIPLDDIIAAKGYDTSVFWPSLLEALSLDGQLHAIPNHAHYGTIVLYYNKTMFENAGIDVPTPDWTYEDMTAAAQELTNAPETWGIRLSGGGQEHIPSYLRTFGGDLLSPDGTRSLLAEPNSRQALQWMYDMRFTAEADPCICGTDTRENFVAGNVGMFNTTPGLIAEFGRVPDWSFEWDATVFPQGPDGMRGSQVSGAGFCVTGNSANPNEAFDVTAFYATQEDGIEHVFGGAGSPGGRFDCWESDQLAEMHGIFRQISETYPEGPEPWYRPANGRTSEFVDTMNNNLQLLWAGEIGFDEGVELVHELCQEVLDNDPI